VPFFRNQRQYQELAFVAVVAVPVVTAVINVTCSSQVTYKGRFQYQSHTEPAFVPPETVTVDKWFAAWRDPVRVSRDPRSARALETSDGLISAPFIPPAAIDVDSWYRPLEQPVRVKIDPRRFITLALDATIDFSPPQVIAVPHGTSAVIFQQAFQYPSLAYTPFVTTAETVTVDKWVYPWTEPVRQKPGLRASLQQAAIGPVLDDETQIIDQFESRWHFPWSEPVRTKRQLPTGEQPFLAYTPQPDVDIDSWYKAFVDPVRLKRDPAAARALETSDGGIQTPFTTEVVDVDSWFHWLETPTPAKPGLRAALQQAAIGPVLDDETQIVDQFESRWHYPWSEPVRFKRFPTAEQQAVAQTLFTPEVVTVDKWTYAWSEPVRFRRFPTAEQSAYHAPVFTPEFVTSDKWIYPWTDPVRTKIGLKTYLQQAFIAPVLDPETQISQDIESRWHFAWSDPVRIKPPLLTAQQQAAAAPATSVFETVTVDKWIYPWTDPVRLKIGLRTGLQQAFIGLTLNPDTQISQDFESRWHFPWSEPVRTRRIPTALQVTAFIDDNSTPEVVTLDKWVYPWTEPVRQKIGLRASLQEALSWPHLSDDQLTGTIESRWHQPWSEPVRFRRFPVSEQPSFTAPATSVFETVTVDKWIYPWTDPVRQKIGIKANLQQAFIGLTLNPETQIIQDFESRWHQPWSEPTRRKPSVASQPSFSWSTFTPTAAAVFEDGWHQPWSIPVRARRPLLTSQQQTYAAPIIPTPVFVSSVSPTVIYPRSFQYQSFTTSVFTPDVSRFESWHQPFSTPLRKKLWLNAPYQRAFTPETPVFPNLVRTIAWFAPLNEPVRLKIGLGARYQRFFQTSQEQVLSDVFVTISATEVNSDSAFFGITVYNQVPAVSRVPTTVVSIKEIPAVRQADVSTEEVPAIDNASVSIEET
jgi:hypothetical protein